jgi:hypothetical protein
MLRPFHILCISLTLLLALPATSLAARQRSPSLTLENVNDAEWQLQGKPSTPSLVKLQVLLDRAHASPGEIDGTLGEPRCDDPMHSSDAVCSLTTGASWV